MSNEVLLAVIGIAGTVLGGAGLKLIESWLGHSVRRLDDAAAIRQELRTESRELRLEIRRLDDEIDVWRTKFYELTEKYSALHTACDGWETRHTEQGAEITRLRALLDARAAGGPPP